MKRIIIPVFLSIVIGLIYIHSLPNSAISDDFGIERNLVTHYALSDISPVPLRNWLYRVLYIIFGFQPMIFRIPNILFHIGSAICLYFIIKKLFNNSLALASSLLFAVHPIAVESVAWISAGNYPQSAFFLYCAFLLYINSHKKTAILLSLFIFLLSQVSSEKAFVYVLIFPLYEWFFGSLQKNWKNIIAFLIIAFVCFFYQSNRAFERFEILSYVTSQTIVESNYMFYVFSTIGMYIQRIIYPVWLSIYPTVINAPLLLVVRWYILTSGFILFSLYGLIKRSHAGFFLMIFIISISYTLSPIPLASSYAERYVYFGYVGILVAILLLVQNIQHLILQKAHTLTPSISNLTFPISKVFLITNSLLFTTICILFAIRSYVRILDWKNTRTYILGAYRDSPNNPKVRNLMAELYIEDQSYDKAIAELETAIQLAPTYFPAYYNLGLLHEKIGDIKKAKYWYSASLQNNPSQWQSAYQLGIIYKNEGNIEEAKRYLTIVYNLTNNPDVQKTIDSLLPAKK